MVCLNLIFWPRSQEGSLPYCKMGAKLEGNIQPGPLLVENRFTTSKNYKILEI